MYTRAWLVEVYMACLCLHLCTLTTQKEGVSGYDPTTTTRPHHPSI